MPTSSPNAATTYPDALGVIELGSIVRGHRVLDQMVKRAPVRVRRAYAVSSGKFLIFVDGGVAELEEALDAGLAAAGERLLGSLLLSSVHPLLWPALDACTAREHHLGVGMDDEPLDAMGLLESASVVDVILGVDAALKAAELRLALLHLARSIGGRAYAVLSGGQSDLEAGIEAALARMREELLIESDVITAPHDDMTRELLGLSTIHPKY
ncbi:MAG: BMC domain-containing protein [Myxococcota bacterium]|jgi:microcompartment protein CcmL/EutN|nr:BMC domain-containing protein [Myxococcota bacterium]